jgi:hypothetical protein
MDFGGSRSFQLCIIFVCIRDEFGMRVTIAGRRKGSPPGWSLRGQEMVQDSRGAAWPHRQAVQREMAQSSESWYQQEALDRGRG